MERINPCRNCGLKEQDKNNSTCRNCDKRLAYLRGLTRDLEFTASVNVDHWYPLHLPH
jgi:hypothetical protein